MEEWLFLEQLRVMPTVGEIKRPQILVIDGGNMYQRLLDRLHECFDLVHLHSPTEGLEFANNCSSLDGILVDLMHSAPTGEMMRPSLLGLWVVEQLREFATCFEIPILVASHWKAEIIAEAAKTAKIDFRNIDCHYVQMSEVDAIMEFFRKESGSDQYKTQ